MLPAAEGRGLTVTANAIEGRPFPQAFVPVTVIVPDAARAEKLTVITFVFAPETIPAPVGKDQA